MTSSGFTRRAEVPDFVFHAALLGVDGVTEVILARHAEQEAAPATNALKARLTARGRRQARALAERLARGHLDAVISSPVRRAVETASFVAEAAGLKVEVDHDLGEIEHFRGIPPGVDPRAHVGEEAWAKMAQDYALRRAFDAIPFFESGAEVRARSRRVVEAAVARFRGGRVVLVSHNPVIAAFAAEVLRSPFDFPFRTDAAAINTFAAKDGAFVLRAANDSAHLIGVD